MPVNLRVALNESVLAAATGLAPYAEKASPVAVTTDGPPMAQPQPLYQMQAPIFAVPPNESGRPARSSLFDPKRESGDVRSRPYTTFTEKGWRDDIKARAMDVYVRVDRTTSDLRQEGYRDSSAQVATLLCEACEMHGPTTDEEAVEFLAATPLRDAIALVPTLRRCLVQDSGSTARVDWILAARVALCAEFFRFRYVMSENSESDDLAQFAKAAAAQWKTYLRSST